MTPTDITSNIIEKTEKKLSSKGGKVARVIPADSILCTCIASIGKNAIIRDKSAFNQQINSLTPNKDNDPYFLLTESYHWSEFMKRQGGGLTFQIVNKQEFSNIETNVLILDEQIEIGYLFKCLDKTIVLHQRKLSLTKGR